MLFETPEAEERIEWDRMENISCDRVHLFHLRQIFSSPFNCNRIEVRRIVARDQFRDGLKTAAYIWGHENERRRRNTRSKEEEIHRSPTEPCTSPRVRVSPPFHPPLNSSTTNPCRFSLPRQLLRAFTPITLDGFPPLLPFFVYMEQCTGNTIEDSKSRRDRSCVSLQRSKIMKLLEGAR